MIDKRGCELHANIGMLIELEEESFSDSLSVAIECFDAYMNKLNGTEGILYNKEGEMLMKC